MQNDNMKQKYTAQHKMRKNIVLKELSKIHDNKTQYNNILGQL